VDVRVVDCTDRPEPVEEQSRAAIREWIPAAPVQASGSVDLEALAVAVSSDEVAVLSITDARGPAASPRTGGLRRVGRDASNRAITSCRIVDDWPLPRVSVACELERVGTSDRLAEVRVVLAGVELTRGTVEFDEDRATFEASFERRDGGRLVIELCSPDVDFAADDRVAFEIPPAPRPGVAVLGPADAEGGVIGIAAELLAEFGGGEVLESGVERAGFVLVDGGAVAGLPARAVVFGSRLGDAGADQARIRPTVVDWDRVDPLLAGADLSELRVARAIPSAALPAGRTLISGEDGPLAVVVDRGAGARTLCTAFRLEDSNLGLLAAFPQILGRAYRSAWGASYEPRQLPGNILSSGESIVRAAPLDDRALPAFGGEDRRLVVPLVLLALFALALRILV
ncbi:MAG: hypothetical protein KDB80_14460, partial [Planctomycetes bacterium]|nr:hypothetical protein [Planctomycetota bacterium]